MACRPLVLRLGNTATKYSGPRLRASVGLLLYAIKLVDEQQGEACEGQRHQEPQPLVIARPQKCRLVS